MLDEFSTNKVDTAQDASKSPTVPMPELSEDAEVSDAATLEFSQQLQDQMAALLGNVDETPEMRKEIEAMMQELGVAADPGPAESTSAATKSTETQTMPSSGEDDFQETIRKTMERMRNSGEQASTAAASAESEDVLSELLKEMQSGDLNGVDGEEGFSKLLLSMMEQLTNKDILYEPMKELHEKFPEWMNKNKDSVKRDDLRRYEDQQRLVAEIVQKFDEKGYSDSKAADRQYIVERMQQVGYYLGAGTDFMLMSVEQMQAAGSPPPDLVGDMNAAQEALGNLDAGCPQQ